MKKAEEGDFTVRVNVKGRDEMGSLAENLNIMIEKLQFGKARGRTISSRTDPEGGSNGLDRRVGLRDCP